MEFITGILPVTQKANYLLRNALQRASRLPERHIINQLANAPATKPSLGRLRLMHVPTDNIWIVKAATAVLPPLHLEDPVTCVGNRLLDCTSRISITIPATPLCSSKVFDQWAKAWMQAAYSDSTGKTVIGTDGSYITKGQGVSAFVVQSDIEVLHTSKQLVGTHSSYDVEMKAAAMAIEYVAKHIDGKVLVFINNQSTLKLLFTVKPHSLFEISRHNSIELGKWIAASPTNEIEFRWMPSHLGFHINKLADQAANSLPIGPFPAPHMTISNDPP